MSLDNGAMARAGTIGDVPSVSHPASAIADAIAADASSARTQVAGRLKRGTPRAVNVTVPFKNRYP